MNKTKLYQKPGLISLLTPEFSTKQLLKALLAAGLLLLCLQSVVAQELTPKSDSLVLAPLTDTIAMDSLKRPAGTLKYPVNYSAKDSIVFDMPAKKVYLYKSAKIDYDKIKLQADYIEIDFNKKVVTATGWKDTSNILRGNPVFEEGEKKFRSKKLVYNFETKKGVISEVITQEGEGYLHGSTIKKLGNDNVNISSGSYTTCELDHPHYEFRFSKSAVIPNNKIVTGPVYLAIADVPTPLMLPFAMFPNKKGAKSGILIPTYGESAQRGFFFENFGYYFNLGEHIDFELRGDVYTLGSWAVKGASRYNKRYKFNGYVNLNYAINKIGTPGSPDFSSNRDFSFRWTHNQDAKARPNSRFGANVNIVTSKYNQYNPTSTAAYLSNTFQSSVSYQTNFSGKYFLNASLTHSQNTIQRTVAMTLPNLSFTVNRFYPFVRKEKSGPNRWYEKIGVNLQSNAENSISTYDSLLFTAQSSKLFRNGLKNTGSISSPINILKYFVLTNTVSFNDRWYTQKHEKQWVDTIFGPIDTIAGYVKTDTMHGIFSNRDLVLSSSISTMVYGLVQFKKGYLRGIRHVITPSVSFSYVPGFSDPKWGAYNTYVDGNGKKIQYATFENSIYGGPPAEKSGRLGFSILNTLELKVKSRKDTVTGFKKVPIIENFMITTSYDLAKDSLRWAPVSLSGHTRIFKKIDISYASILDPYILDSAGTSNLNQFEWNVNKRLLRLENSSWSLSLNYNITSSKLKPKSDQSQKVRNNAGPNEMADIQQGKDNYVDFNIPWTLNISYSFRYIADNTYLNYYRKVNSNIIQNLNFYGDVNVSPRWKIGVRSGYDFINKDISYTSVDIYRDLHCWEMRFGWIPKGTQKSWNFTINAKASLLQDLKLNKKKDFRDY